MSCKQICSKLSLFVFFACSLAIGRAENIANLPKESPKVQAVVSECMKVCRITDPTEFRLREPSPCPTPESKVFVAAVGGFCESDAKLRVTIVAKRLNRFGEVYFDTAQCRFIGGDMSLVSDCPGGQLSVAEDQAEHDRKKRDELLRRIMEQSTLTR
jgi:hypothetical protein